MRSYPGARSVTRGPRTTHGAPGGGVKVELPADADQPVEMLVERVLPPVVLHPLGQEGSAPADDVQAAALPDQTLEGLPRHPAVDRHQIDPVLGLLHDPVEKVVAGELDPGFPPGDGVGGRLVDRDGPDGNRTFREDRPADVVDRSPGGQVHHRVGAGCPRAPHLRKLQRHIRPVARGTHVRVHLDAQTLPDGDGPYLPALPVPGKNRLPRGDEDPELLRGDSFFPGRERHLRRDHTIPRVMQQRHASPSFAALPPACPEGWAFAKQAISCVAAPREAKAAKTEEISAIPNAPPPRVSPAVLAPPPPRANT